MTTPSLRDLRDHLSQVRDRVEHQHARVVVPRNGRPAAVILSLDDLAQLEETIDVLGDAQDLADILTPAPPTSAVTSCAESTTCAGSARNPRKNRHWVR